MSSVNCHRGHVAEASPRCVGVVLGALIFGSLAWGQVPDSVPERASIALIDGTVVDGEWRGIDAESGVITVQAKAGAEAIAPGDAMSIRFASRKTSPIPLEVEGGESPELTTLFLGDGGHLPGVFLGGDSDGLLATTALGSSVPIPFDRLSGIRLTDTVGFTKAEALLQSALGDRLPGQDVLITRDSDEPKLLRGRLADIGLDRGSFALGQRTRTFKTNRIYALVFASGVKRPRDWSATFELTDGSRFSGSLESGDEHSVSVSTSIGTTVRLSLSYLRRIQMHSPRVVFLSDLVPARTDVEGRLHRQWPVATDRALTGTPLSIGQTHYEKGIGCHSRTEIRYELLEPFETFVTDVGIDSHVRPRGSVEFRVLGDDGTSLYSSGLVTGRDEPKKVRVPLDGAKSLTLLVDYGDELDIADHAVWGGARLLRP